MSMAVDYIVYALEKEKEQAVWDLWTQLYPWMVTEFIIFKSFDEFKRELLKPAVKHSNKTLEEIEQEMDRVIAAYKKKA